jgi:hypothetical protein
LEFNIGWFVAANPGVDFDLLADLTAEKLVDGDVEATGWT